MANPAWIKGMKSPNPVGNLPYRQRFKKVEKTSAFEKKILLYLINKWGQMVDDIEKLNEKDRVKARQELMSYAIPKKAAASDGISREEYEKLEAKFQEVLNEKQYGQTG